MWKCWIRRGQMIWNLQLPPIVCVFLACILLWSRNSPVKNAFQGWRLLSLVVWKAEGWTEWGCRVCSLAPIAWTAWNTSFHSPRGKLLHIFQYSAQRLLPLGSLQGKTPKESLWVLIHFTYVSFIVFLLFHNFHFSYMVFWWKYNFLEGKGTCYLYFSRT